MRKCAAAAINIRYIREKRIERFQALRMHNGLRAPLTYMRGSARIHNGRLAHTSSRHVGATYRARSTIYADLRKYRASTRPQSHQLIYTQRFRACCFGACVYTCLYTGKRLYIAGTYMYLDICLYACVRMWLCGFSGKVLGKALLGEGSRQGIAGRRFKKP